MSVVTRRLVLAAAGVATAAASFPAPASARSWPKGAFTHGVASGDPTATSVILWTRFVPSSAGAAAQIGWEVAEDESFKRVVKRGRVAAGPTTDYCAKVDVRGLKPGKRYAYRFLAGEGPSVTGLTRTAPEKAETLGIALFSCSNLPFGYFNAYADAAKREDVDLCIHVGDYIYEYQRGKYPDAKAAMPDRVIEPAGEIITWNDYHLRYQSYRADPDLQELHRVKPWITVWDDHELANNAWMDGAEEHDPPEEGTWVERLANAAQAYFDWLPIRGTRAAPWRIHRSTDWGDLATIVALDTRRIGRQEQLDYATLAPAIAQGPQAAMAAVQSFVGTKLMDPSRTLLGAEQEAFVEAELKRSKAKGATWQVLAQQLVTGKQVAAPQLAGMLADDAPAFVKQFAAVGAQLAALGLEWNLDSWGGYPAARQRLLAACRDHGSNAIVLSGDSHNAWIYDLPGGKDGRPAAIEVAGTSVTSPGFESTFTKTEPGGREAAMRAANPDLKWCDVTQKGYAAVTLTREAATAEYVLWPSMRTKAGPSSRVTLTSEATPDRGPGGWTLA